MLSQVKSDMQTVQPDKKIIMNRILLVFLLFLFSFTMQANAIDIIAPGIDGLIKADEKDAYQVLIKEAAKRAGIDYKEHFFPQKRALSYFLVRSTHAFMHIRILPYPGWEKIRISFPLGIFKQYIFTKAGSSALTSIDQLKGKRVGGILGDDEQDRFSAFEKAKINYVFVTRIEQNVKKLLSGRIDTMISFMPDVAAYEDTLSYVKDKPLFSSFDMIDMS